MRLSEENGGRGGIRTHGWLLANARFRVECLQPDSATLPIGNQKLVNDFQNMNPGFVSPANPPVKSRRVVGITSWCWKPEKSRFLIVIKTDATMYGLFEQARKKAVTTARRQRLFAGNSKRGAIEGKGIAAVFKAPPGVCKSDCPARCRHRL